MKSNKYIRELKMSRLLDRRYISSFILIFILKILQFVKKMGFRVKENGWRKFAGVYLRKEHSKFILTGFRLKSFNKYSMPSGIMEAKKMFIDRFAVFLRKNTDCHWGNESGIFRARSKKLHFTDIVEAKFDDQGVLLELEPYLDDTRITFTKLSDKVIVKALNKIVVLFNRNAIRGLNDIKRSKIISKKLRRWAWKTTGLSFLGRREMFHFTV